MNVLKKNNMNEEEILVGNKLIAEFMNVEETQGHYNSYGMEVPTYQIVHNLYNGRSYSKPALSYDAFIRRAEYHFNWQWLMPCFNKLRELGFSYKISERECMIKSHASEYNVTLICETTLISCYEAMVDFTKWHNKNK